ncbi:cation:proton antiporter [Roseiflexus castenholzii]|jgi:Kef-type K+ transport system membrane component KefB|uniref:Sodium/hydrogen exchanger n=1 Tax=Roseiflexus castenholzii (strain DSM 13941 / HLO8) TaxID=383372 RepID=A7NLG5_ROSCS|nr:cation:proton antiporter [Roseiflexus castenholzii]ABU58348.1 sodium/hydrogen exchanger [Roseiflexus castenholzii DSM 13941]
MEEHHSPVELLPMLAAILIGAKLAGRLSQRLGLPAVFGELVLGLVLGPSLLNLIRPNDPLALLAEVGVILLMFRAGLETDLVQMRQVGLAATMVALGGVLLPFGGGFALGRLFGLDMLPSLFVGAVLTATSVSISAEVLRELGHLRSKVGATILGAAVIDDVLGVLVLSLVLGLAGEGNPLVAIGQMAIFFPAAWLVGDKLLPQLRKIEHLAGGQDTVLAILLGLVMLFAWAAEALGSVADITGAYLLGIVVARYTDEEHVVHHGSSALAYAFVVPVFFVNIGLEANVTTLGAMPLFTIIMVALAIAGKVVGCGVGAMAMRLSWREAVQIGVGMVARGEVALVMIAAGRAAGLVNDVLFTSTIVMALLTTLITPPLLRLAFAHPKPPPAGERSAVIEAAE